MQSIPKDYNSSKLAVDPITLSDSCDKLTDAAQNIGTALGDIMNCLSELRISWTGDSADVADDFNQRWSKVTGELYGTEAAQIVNTLTFGGFYAADPGAEGVIPALTKGVAKAAGNYANGEGAVKAMFWNLGNGLAQSGGSGGSSHTTVDQPSGINGNYHTTAVNEIGL
ncbi:hypothetical protein AB0N07_44130 [Streptomyces sp. NPDC051172]|uniref:WXG100 family type VII secretion target n=1 Tax=Streptomyces sp. NPDC051172 TaxID=3155796 RepID=UPI00343369F3